MVDGIQFVLFDQPAHRGPQVFGLCGARASVGCGAVAGIRRMRRALCGATAVAVRGVLHRLVGARAWLLLRCGRSSRRPSLFRRAFFACRSTPETLEGISTLALSVSSSTTGSSVATYSPSFFSHRSDRGFSNRFAESGDGDVCGHRFECPVPNAECRMWEKAEYRGANVD